MPEPQHDNYALIPHSSAASALLLKTSAGWMLPRHGAREAPAVNQAMREQLGLDVTLLRAVYDRYQDDEREEQHIVYALENHSPAWNPPEGGAWISAEELQDLPMVVPEHRAVLEKWFAETSEEQQASERVPWACRGWYAKATAWIQEQLSVYGYQLRAPIEQIHVRVWSCVLRVPTMTGDLYFKAASPAFAYEPVLTAGLAQLWPAHLPGVLAVDTLRHWMLMEDAGTTLRRSEQARDLSAWTGLLDLFARMQIDSAAHQEQLLALGCPDRRLESLPALFDALLHDRSALLIGQKDGLNEEEDAKLREMGQEIKTLCAELADYGIPEALHHDDFHDGNIMLKKGRYLFFDWAECALAHPFYSPIIVLRFAKHVLKCNEDELARLRDAYLAPWTIYAPMESLLPAFELAQRLGLLCRALTWHQTISSLEESERWSYASSVPWNLRSFLYYPRDLLV